ncbi:MAG: hypothetical protein IJ033_02010 [Clostridia bacterium]|nr:hypothetical protein [Clostridia bacterium]
MLAKQLYLEELNEHKRGLIGKYTGTAPSVFVNNLPRFFVKKDREQALALAPYAYVVGLATCEKLKLKSYTLGPLLLIYYIVPGLLFSLLGINRFRIKNIFIGLCLLTSFSLSLTWVILTPYDIWSFITLGVVALWGLVDLLVSRLAYSKFNLKILEKYTSSYTSIINSVR